MRPWPLQRDASAFYGDPREQGWYERNIVFVVPPFPMLMEMTPIRRISVHRKCATALGRVLDAIAPAGKLLDGRAALFDGSYNPRNIRGSNVLSMHAYGCAFDFAADDNPQGGNAATATLTPQSPLVKAFLAEGAEWGGEWSGQHRDPMHFQFARTA